MASDNFYRCVICGKNNRRSENMVTLISRDEDGNPTEYTLCPRCGAEVMEDNNIFLNFILKLATK